MTWIDRQTQEPQTDESIIVWGDGDGPCGAVSCFWDYESWLDVADRRDVSFRYWIPAPGSPYFTATELARNNSRWLEINRVKNEIAFLSLVPPNLESVGKEVLRDWIVFRAQMARGIKAAVDAP